MSERYQIVSTDANLESKDLAAFLASVVSGSYRYFLCCGVFGLS